MFNRTVLVALALAVALAFPLEDASAQVTVGTAAEGRTWAESLVNVESWDGEWFRFRGLTVYSGVANVVRSGVDFEVSRAGGANRKVADSFRHVRTYRHANLLIHEFSATCYPQFNAVYQGTVKVFVAFHGPRADGGAIGYAQIDGCGMNVRQEKERSFIPVPYPSLR